MALMKSMIDTDCGSRESLLRVQGLMHLLVRHVLEILHLWPNQQFVMSATLHDTTGPTDLRLLM